MKRTTVVGVLVTLALGVTLASASPAPAPGVTREGIPLMALSGYAQSTPVALGPLFNDRVFADPAISPAALSLQRRVAAAHVAHAVNAALGDAFAGVWLEPATAQFHIGVISSAGRQAAEQVATRAGLAGEVVETPVRSTWSALMAAQNRWDRRHEQLLESDEAMTGIDPPRNSVSVSLSSSVSLSERHALESEAASARVDISVAVVDPSQLPITRKTSCKAPFVEKEAFCEKTIVSGVRILPKGCTAGPMLIEGSATYVLTAGHCLGPEENEDPHAITEAVTSAYPTSTGTQKEIGKEGTWYNFKPRDFAEVKVNPKSQFAQEGTIPVPALMAEWAKNPGTPHAVEGVEEAISGQEICHEGQSSGENCGEVGKLNVTGAGTEHVVEISACSNAGDSGGPYFMRTGKEKILVMGTEVGGPMPDCNEKGPYKSYFEPLIGLAGAAEFGILATFKGQEVLTVLNERRPCG
jgi:Trypsin